jgi:hypothetical protein
VKPTTETLQVVWKIIRRPYPCCRTKEIYCSYIAENKNHKHKLKTVEGTKLFDILASTVVSKLDKYEYKVYLDGVYHDGKLLYVTNFRKI